MEENKYVYRIEDNYVYMPDGTMQNDPSITRFKVIKETPCGRWIERVNSWGEKKKFIHKDQGTNFAKENPKDLALAYLKRKQRQRRCLEQELQKAEIAHAAALELFDACHCLGEGATLDQIREVMHKRMHRLIQEHPTTSGIPVCTFDFEDID